MLLLLSMLACGEKSSDTSTTDSTSDTSVEDTEQTDTSIQDTQEESASAETLHDIVITEYENPCGVTGSGIAVNGQGEEYLSISCTEPQIADEEGVLKCTMQVQMKSTSMV